LKQISSAPESNKFIADVRKAFLVNTRGVSQDSRGLVAGLAIGDTSLISSKLQMDMKAVSLTHLTAVSGANCAIVLAMAFLIVRKFGGNRWMKLGVGLGTLVAYASLVGDGGSGLDRNFNWPQVCSVKCTWFGCSSAAGCRSLACR
jgi:competence protein ComEC